MLKRNTDRVIQTSPIHESALSQFSQGANSFFACLIAICIAVTPAVAQTSTQDDEPTLADKQRLIQTELKGLEQKLFDLYEYESDENPDRSRLLRSAFQQSQQRRIAILMETIAGHLEEDDYGVAVESQRTALAELQLLLALLENENETQRLEDEQRRTREYILETERILRIQRGIRGQVEGGVPPDRLENAQESAAERAGDLADDIRTNEEGQQAQEGGDNEPNSSNDNPQSPNSDQPNPEQPGSDNQPMPPNGDEQQPSDSNESPSADNANPARQSIERAQQRMQQAQRRLNDARRAESVEEMRAAEAELGKAIEELEEILRQLRNQEIERKLTELETRFKEMLEEQERIAAATDQLSEIAVEQRGGEFHIQSSKLGVEQQQLAMEADNVLLALQEEGSSVAFPETVLVIRDDMEQVSAWLREAKVDTLTQTVQEDIIASLRELIDAMLAAQEANQEQQQQNNQSPNSGQPGEAPLVQRLEELRMVRSLQIRINQRHNLYAEQIGDPLDPVGYSDDPDIQEALQQLSERQRKLQQITRDIINQQ